MFIYCLFVKGFFLLPKMLFGFAHVALYSTAKPPWRPPLVAAIHPDLKPETVPRQVEIQQPKDFSGSPDQIGAPPTEVADSLL